MGSTLMVHVKIRGEWRKKPFWPYVADDSTEFGVQFAVRHGVNSSRWKIERERLMHSE